MTPLYDEDPVSRQPRVREWMLRVDGPIYNVRLWIARGENELVPPCPNPPLGLTFLVSTHPMIARMPQEVADEIIELDERINAVEVVNAAGIGALAYRDWP
jgi:hypothetical protein